MSRLFAASMPRVFTVCSALALALLTQFSSSTPASAVDGPWKITGTVTSAAAGDPTGSEVYLFSKSKGVLDSTTVTANDTYTVTLQPADSGTVYLIVLPVQADSASAYTVDSTTVTTAAPSTTITKNITLRPSVVRGTITTQVGPVYDADVICLDASGNKPSPIKGCGASSNKDGWYAIPAVPGIVGQVGIVVRSGVLAEYMSDMPIDTPTVMTPRTANVTLQPANLIVAVTAGGQPVPEWGVDVGIGVVGQDGGGGASVRGDGKAYFAVPPETYNVQAQPNQQAWSDAGNYSNAETTTVVPVGGIRTVTIALAAAANNVRVIATFDTNTALSSANIDIRKWTVGQQGGGYFQGGIGGKQTNGSGVADMQLGDGIWQLVSDRRANLGLAASSIIVRVVAGSPTTFSTCKTLQFDFQSGACGESETAVVVDTATGLAPIQLKALKANTVVVVKNPANANVAGAYVDVRKWFNGGSGGYFTSSGMGDGSAQDGTAAFNLPNGVYELAVQPPKNLAGSTATSVYLSISDTATAKCASVTDGTCNSPTGVTRSNGVASLNVAIKQSNVTWRFVSGGTPVTGVNVYYQKQANGQFGSGTGAFSQDTNTVSLNLESGLYMVNVQPMSGSATASNFIIQVTTDSSSAVSALSRCAQSDFDWGAGVCMSGKSTEWTSTSAGSGIWELSLASQNFLGTVCKPSPVLPGCETVTGTNMSVEVQKKTMNPGGYGFYFSYSSNAMVSMSEGTFGLALTDGDYRVVVRRPFNATGAAASWTDTSYGLQVSGSGTVFKRCDLNVEVCGAAESATAGSRFKVHFAQPNFIAQVINSANSDPAPRAWVEVLQPNPNQCDGCRTWLQGTNADSAGQVFLQLSKGTYILGVNPPPGVTSSNVRTEFTVVISETGSVSSVTGSTKSGSTWLLKFAGANVSGYVKSGSNYVANADIQVEKKDGDFWQWQPTYARTDSTGYFAISLTKGSTYRLRVTPSGTSGASLASKVTDSFLLGDSGYSETITLSAPNVSGTVTGGGVSVSYAWIQVDKWDAQMQNYMWSPEVPGTNTNFNGAFALTLPDGRWRLTVNPQPESGYSKFSKEVWVNGATVTQGALGADTYVSAIALSQGNVSGTVYTTGSNTAKSGYVNVERYNATLGFWEWVDLWANVGNTGTFKMNIQKPGGYKLTVNPPPGDNTYSRTVKYVNVVDSGGIKVCAAADEAAAKLGTCASPAETLALSVTLTGANVTGKVIASGTAVRDAWISVQQYDSKLGYWNWLGGTNTNSSGSYALNLNPGTYRLEVNPPWNNSSGLVRQYVSVTKTADNLAVPTIVLSSGNLSGKVTELFDTGTAVAYTNIMVEKWLVAPWDPNQYTWQWADMPMNTKSDGTFGGNIADTSGTLYKFTAFPGGYSNGLSKASIIMKAVVTNGDLKWCQLTNNAKVNNSSDANPFGNCTASTNDSVKLVLTGATVTGKIYSADGTTPLRDVWVGVARTKNAAGNDIWEWQGGSPSSATGAFALNLDFTETGTYRVEFNPPWGGGASLSRFTATVTVSGCSGGTCSSVTTSSKLADTYTAGALTWNLKFPGANLSGTICDPDDQVACTAVPKAWVNVFEETGTASTWTDLGSGTDMTGTYRLSLTAGKVYRLEANPSWENPKGVRSNTFVRICTNGTTYETGTRDALLGSSACSNGSNAALSLFLGKPNVTGSVKATATAVARAWIEVRTGDGSSFVSGTNADGNGEFQLSLPNGTYLLRTFSGGTIQKAPVQVKVVVAGGVVSSWSYCGSLSETQTACAASGGSGTVAIDMNAAATSASVNQVSIDSDLSGKHFVAIYKCTSITGSTCNGEAIDTSYTVVTDDNGEATVALPAGSWKLAGVALPNEVLTGYSSVITVTGSGTTSLSWPSS